MHDVRLPLTHLHDVVTRALGLHFAVILSTRHSFSNQCLFRSALLNPTFCLFFFEPKFIPRLCKYVLLPASSEERPLVLLFLLSVSCIELWWHLIFGGIKICYSQVLSLCATSNHSFRF